jgi:hypothetical protein
LFLIFDAGLIRSSYIVAIRRNHVIDAKNEKKTSITIPSTPQDVPARCSLEDE